MKKLLSILMTMIFAFGASLSLVACKEEDSYLTYPPNEITVVLEDNFGNTYNIECKRVGENWEYQYQDKLKLEYIKNNNSDATISTKGLYCDGTPLPEKLYTVEYGGPYTFYLGSVGNKREYLMRYYINAYDNKGETFIISVVEFDICANVLASTERISDYVTIQDVVIPYEYFSQEMREVTEDYYDLSSVSREILGMKEADNYQYGYSIEMAIYEDGKEITTYDSNVANHRLQNGAIWETEQYHYLKYENGKKDREIYQYLQSKDGEGYCLNETDEEFTCGTLGMSGFSDCSSFSPSHLVLLWQGETLTYKATTKGLYTYLLISGTYEYKYSSAYDDVSAEIVYVIKNNEVVAWLYNETRTSDADEGYWKETRYCIPLEEDIELLDENYLASICNR